jgi:hypothetical protein
VNTTDYLGLFTLTDIFNRVKIEDRRKDISEGKRGRRKQILDVHKEKRGYWNLR